MTAAGIKLDWPAKREKPVGVKVKLQEAETSAWFFDETTVTFTLGGKEFHGWMPDYSVNIAEKWLKAIIVGDFDNGDWEILIPEETVQSTVYLRVPKADQGTTVVDGWW